jgi:endo-1,3-1,4-beta-glycanase ExoK
MSGEVMTHETYKYGKFVTRMKADDKKGTCTSFFTFWKGTEDEEWSKYGWSEIDIELVPSAKWGTYSTNIIWRDQKMSGHQVGRDTANPQDDWAYYEFQWTPDYIAFLYNGQEVRRVEDTEEVEWL